jgi:predicted molibdopterin-dependent oxidoreductase YjgC
MGALPNLLAGHMEVDDEAARVHVGAIWQAKIPASRGLAAPEMIQDIASRKIRALYVIGENPKLSDPDWNHLHHALKNLDLLVVQELFLSETAQVADIVLPAASVAEKDGTFTNTERRCLRIRKAIEPVGNALPDWQIIARLSEAMGHPMPYASAEDIFNEITALTPKSYGGMNYGEIERPGG